MYLKTKTTTKQLTSLTAKRMDNVFTCWTFAMTFHYLLLTRSPNRISLAFIYLKAYFIALYKGMWLIIQKCDYFVNSHQSSTTPLILILWGKGFLLRTFLALYCTREEWYFWNSGIIFINRKLEFRNSRDFSVSKRAVLPQIPLT